MVKICVVHYSVLASGLLEKGQVKSNGGVRQFIYLRQEKMNGKVFERRDL
jgi:hypothetical protein